MPTPTRPASRPTSASRAGGAQPPRSSRRATLRTLLRDHYDAGTVHRPRSFDDPLFFSICMHADPLDNTTASMVASLPADPEAPAAIGVSLGSPCVGAFLPVWLDAPVPARLGLGGAEPHDASPWWRMRGLLDLVERDVTRYGPAVRARAARRLQRARGRSLAGGAGRNRPSIR